MVAEENDRLVSHARESRRHGLKSSASEKLY